MQVSITVMSARSSKTGKFLGDGITQNVNQCSGCEPEVSSRRRMLQQRASYRDQQSESSSVAQQSYRVVDDRRRWSLQRLHRSVRYSGAVPWKTSNIRTHSLYVIRMATGSQCKARFSLAELTARVNGPS